MTLGQLLIGRRTLQIGLVHNYSSIPSANILPAMKSDCQEHSNEGLKMQLVVLLSPLIRS